MGVEEIASGSMTALCRILLGVQGRFHAFDLANAFMERGDVEVHLATNYPCRVVHRFTRPHYVHTVPRHGVLARIANKMGPSAWRWCEPYLHKSFGRFIATIAENHKFDLIHTFSGVSEEMLRSSDVRGARTIVRGSAHIDEQHRLLLEEEARIGVAIDKPSDWMRDRERREYSLADQIVVISQFAYDSFIRAGVPPNRLALIPLGVNTRHFAATPEQRIARCKRIRSGAPLRVLLAGNFSAQKGALDFLHIAQQLASKMSFTVVGTITRDAKFILGRGRELINFQPRVPQKELPKVYAENDIFVFPTIHDGFAVVIAQAYAAGLAVVATTNCGATDILGSWEGGFVVPIRNPEAFVERLIWMDRNRETLAQVLSSAKTPFMRDWSDVAADFIEMLRRLAIRELPLQGA